MDRERIDRFLMPVQARVKLTDNFYVNMRKIADKMGIHVHPLFKKQPEYQVKTSMFNPDLGPPLTAPEPVTDEVGFQISNVELSKSDEEGEGEEGEEGEGGEDGDNPKEEKKPSKADKKKEEQKAGEDGNFPIIQPLTHLRGRSRRGGRGGPLTD